MARIKGDNEPFVLATVVLSEDATAAKAGAKAIVRADGSLDGWIGGPCAEGPVRKAAAEALIDGKARLIRVRPVEAPAAGGGVEDFTSACPSGGTLEVFVEPILPRPAVVIVGASPVARTLCALAKRIGYAVTTAAPARDAEAFSEADHSIEGFDLAGAPRIGAAFVVVATQGRRDRDALAAALASPAPYVAFVASRRKAAQLKEELVAGGALSERVAGLRSPAGLDIGAATPAEIALSVLADIVREHRAGLPAARPRDDMTARAVERVATPAGDCCAGG